MACGAEAASVVRVVGVESELYKFFAAVWVVVSYCCLFNATFDTDGVSV